MSEPSGAVFLGFDFSTQQVRLASGHARDVRMYLRPLARVWRERDLRVWIMKQLVNEDLTQVFFPPGDRHQKPAHLRTLATCARACPVSAAACLEHAPAPDLMCVFLCSSEVEGRGSR